FANHNALIPFELLSVDRGKLVFFQENQGGWACGTQTEGRDPPVWVTNDDTWQPLETTLAPFLVTACLLELFCGCKHRARGEGLMDRFRASGKQITPLWINGPFVGRFRVSTMQWETDRLSFYLIDGRAMVWEEDECRTNSDEFRDEFP